MKVKRHAGLFSLVTMLALTLLFSVNVFAAGDNINSATRISLGVSYSGTISETNSVDFYRFELPSSGRLTLNAQAYMRWVYYKLYDASGKELNSKNPSWNDTTHQISTSEYLDLKKGVYYFSVRKDGSYTGNYTFSLSFASAYETFTEDGSRNNNDMGSAEAIGFGRQYLGQIALNDDRDFYRVTLPSSGRLTFQATVGMQWIYYSLYDANGKEVVKRNPSWNGTTKQIAIDDSYDLIKGTYYLAFAKDGSRTGNYSFSLSFSSASESFEESLGDNNIYGANPISVGGSYNGQIALNDDTDFYCFTVSAGGSYSVNVEAGYKWAYVKLYDSAGKELWSQNPSWNSVTSKIVFSKESTLTAGTYYLSVSKDGSYTGNYSLRVSGTPTVTPSTPTVTPSTPTVTPSTPTVTPSTPTVTPSAPTANSTAKKVRTFRKAAKKITIKIAAGRKKAKVRWKRIAGVRGYLIRYSRYKNMKGSQYVIVSGGLRQSMYIKRLAARKRYYFQVRAYKVIDGKVYYGAWSKRKSVVVRK